MKAGLDTLVLAWSEWMTAMATQIAILMLAIALLDRLLAGFGFIRLRNGLYLLVAAKLILPPSLAAWWRAPIEATDTGAGIDAPGALPIVLFAVWLSGCLLFTCRLVLAGRTLRRRLIRGSYPADDRVCAVAQRAAASIGLTPTPPIRVGGSEGPAVIGCLWPVVVLPERSLAWRPDDLEHALAHELAHIRRNDLWLEAAFAALGALYWFHPAVHFARRRAHALREMCCDASVSTRRGPGYRRSLVRLAAATLLERPPGLPAAAASLLGNRSQTIARLRALERVQRRHPAQPPMLAASLVLAGCLALPMARPSAPRAAAVSDLTSARALALRVADERLNDPSTTGSLHVRWAVLQLNRQEARTAGHEEE